MSERKRAPRAERMRWSTASELLRLVHAEPGITRAAAAERLALSSGAAAELIERLRAARLLAEERAERNGPGRPTTVLLPHPEGPLAVAVDLATGGWRVARGELGGGATEIASGAYETADEGAAAGDVEAARAGSAGIVGAAAAGSAAAGSSRPFLPAAARAVADAVRGGAGRVRAVAVAVAGAVSGETLLFFANRDWAGADLRSLVREAPRDADLAFAVGNDAALAGTAEARSGAARGAAVALHVMITVGVGGSLVVDGRPMTGARGAGGEYGHLPMGDAALECPCGARGCWGLAVDGRALARHRGDRMPDDPYGYGARLLEGVRRGAASVVDAQASARAAEAFGAGVAGLVNLHDPDVVTIAGLAPALRAASPDAFEGAYRRGLMAFHRASPPPVVDAAHGDDGPLRGALALGFDEATAPEALARWRTRG